MRWSASPPKRIPLPERQRAVPLLKRASLKFVAALLGVLLAQSAWSREIVVASYNVENYLKMERRVEGKTVQDAPKPGEEIAAAVDVIKEINPDILGLVEMGDESMLEDLRSRLKAVGLDYPNKEWVQGADAARHLSLLSRFPIVVRSSRDDVPFELNGAQMRIGRGILDVTVQLSEKYPLRLVGVHLKSRREVPEFDQVAMRAKEARLVRRHLDTILKANPDENLVLFGDLNDTKNEYPVKELMGSANDPFRMKDLFLSDSFGYRWTHYWATADIYSRIDYFLVSTGLWPEINKEKSGISSSKIWYKASDHRAIFCTIKVPEE